MPTIDLPFKHLGFQNPVLVDLPIRHLFQQFTGESEQKGEDLLHDVDVPAEQPQAGSFAGHPADASFSVVYYPFIGGEFEILWTDNGGDVGRWRDGGLFQLTR